MWKTQPGISLGLFPEKGNHWGYAIHHEETHKTHRCLSLSLLPQVSIITSQAISVSVLEKVPLPWLNSSGVTLTPNELQH